MATQIPQKPMALIVEDDPIVRELAAALLEESDLRVVECEDAEQALATLCKHGEDVALIFSDVRLPGLLDGVDLALRVKVLWPRITMLVTTGYPGDRVDALAGQRRLHAEALASARCAEAGRAGVRSRPRVARGRVRSDHDHVLVRVRSEQARDIGCTPLQREALIDVSLVGDLVRVD